jgi:hypothetical protein
MIAIILASARNRRLLKIDQTRKFKGNSLKRRPWKRNAVRPEKNTRTVSGCGLKYQKRPIGHGNTGLFFVEAVSRR